MQSLVLYAPAFSALAVTMLGCMTATIAYRQWVTARTKVRLDLYERRLPIYNACNDLLLALLYPETITREEVWEFQLKMGAAAWLYDEHVADYVTQLHDVVQDALGLAPKPEPVLGSDMQAWNPQHVARYSAWLADQHRQLNTVFAPYLSIELPSRRSRRKPVRVTPAPLLD